MAAWEKDAQARYRSRRQDLNEITTIKNNIMFTPKDFSHLIGLDGFSDDLLRNHFTLYEGYVKNTNALLELLGTKEAGTPEYSELQRRFGWEWNGMRLHELYFGNMTKSGTDLRDGTLKEKIVSVYGSFENWRKNFVGIGSMRGIGWAMLVRDNESGDVFNIWVNEHDGGYLAGCTPIFFPPWMSSSMHSSSTTDSNGRTTSKGSSDRSTGTRLKNVLSRDRKHGSWEGIRTKILQEKTLCPSPRYGDATEKVVDFDQQYK